MASALLAPALLPTFSTQFKLSGKPGGSRTHLQVAQGWGAPKTDRELSGVARGESSVWRSEPGRSVVRAMAVDGGELQTGSKVEEKLGVRIERNPSESRLSDLGVRSWSKWGCPVSKFPWTYDGKETCYLLKGKVKVYPEGSSDFVEFGAGDLVVFPKGMSCTWEVSAAVDKHYQFEY